TIKSLNSLKIQSKINDLALKKKQNRFKYYNFISKESILTHFCQYCNLHAVQVSYQHRATCMGYGKGLFTVFVIPHQQQWESFWAYFRECHLSCWQKDCLSQSKSSAHADH
ncbi:hypothetical protein ACJ8PO_06730, partial [Serratia sp. CY66160]|uniref:hypothetical protein n=1 Tax=Serratia sp. CY66160 TaxID=3383658 RepID=UPI003F9F14FD